MFDFSPVQIIIVLVIALLVFGPKRLPEMGRNLGRSMREFKNSVSGDSRDDRDLEPDVAEEVAKRQEPPAPTPEIAAAQVVDEQAEAAGERPEREAVTAGRPTA
ncbi:MAG: sec-independent protein translocase protein TatA [Miltoncostaeaceae bacterium]|jgi:sec-independent protein translocase protein TatA|nr:sec-independent protein translocase protein TatA [Miltoncostaeaceae bacterium]